MNVEQKDRSYSCPSEGRVFAGRGGEGAFCLLLSGVFTTDRQGMGRLSPEYFVILARHFASSYTHFSHPLGQSQYPLEWRRLEPRFQERKPKTSILTPEPIADFGEPGW